MAAVARFPTIKRDPLMVASAPYGVACHEHGTSLRDFLPRARPRPPRVWRLTWPSDVIRTRWINWPAPGESGQGPATITRMSDPAGRG
jgi:hypothetical protein